MLRDEQKKFIEKLFTADPAGGGMAVHKNNARMILRDLLRDVFPVTTVLLGDAFMNQAAAEYIKTFPPQGGDMNDYGGALPDMLGHIPAMKDYLYVPDVARLEWLAHEAYLSPRLPALTARDLESAANPLNMPLKLQPHLRLLRSAWPVDRLWARVSAEGAALKDFVLQPQETFIAIYREDRKIALWPLSEGGYAFFENLQSNPSFGLAAEAAIRAENDLQLDQVLARGMQEKIFAS